MIVEHKVRDGVIEVIDLHASLSVPSSTLDSHDDLYLAGMTSHASVSVMIALEEMFDIEFPDEMLGRSLFATRSTIESAITTLLASQ